MTLRDLGQKLKEMYENAPRGEQVTMIHLFGVKFADSIKEVGVKEVIDEAGISSTYRTELNKAINLAKYVRPIN
ncbi:HTH-like domain-containing protein [Pontibacter chitinilyticus]|uniref:HTH-like domain-containing protein n=1 Tax=Pontibacter chitinilyticus TaxID=2674989 RepID=UPI003219A995